MKLSVLVLGFLLASCSPYDDLAQIKSSKADCLLFKSQFEAVGVTDNAMTNRIKEYVKTCVSIGAW